MLLLKNNKWFGETIHYQWDHQTLTFMGYNIQ